MTSVSPHEDLCGRHGGDTRHEVNAPTSTASCLRASTKSHAVCHVLASMGSGTFNDGHSPAVAYSKAFTCTTGGEELPAGCSVECCIPENHVFVRGKTGSGWWGDNDLSAGHTLAHIIIGLS